MQTQKLEKDNLEKDSEKDSVDAFVGVSSNLAAPPRGNSWASLDSKVQDYTPNSGTFLDSAYFSPESVLPASYLFQHSEPDELKREIPGAIKRPVEREEDKEIPSRSTPWLGLIASVSVGIVIAIFVFPVIELVKRSTRSYVTENLSSELNRRLDQYEQINQGNVPSEVMQPLNLALSGWVELPSTVLLANNERTGVSPPVSSHQLIFHGETHLHPLTVDAEDLGESIPLDTSSISEDILHIIPGQEEVVRSAYGQYFLFKNGRTFIRELPHAEPKRK
jgi:hypothetical protein